jgi:diguanylate cyclase (GGDEF)-like protein
MLIKGRDMAFGTSNLRLAMFLSKPVAFTVGLLAAISAGGYAFSVEALYRPIAGGPASHPLTILSALLLAFGIAGQSRLMPRWRAAFAAAVVAVLCIVRLTPGPLAGEVFTLLTPFNDMVARDLQAGMRNGMGTNTATMFLLIALSVLLHWRRWVMTSQIVAFFSIALPMVSITGYAYGLPRFYGDMSLMTVTFGLPLGLAAAGLTAHHAVLRALLSPHITGRIARVQVMLGYFFPFVTGFLLLKAIGERGETSLFGVFVVAISWFIILLVAISGVVHERIDHARRLNERALGRSATVDPLTGAFNRRKFDLSIEAEVQRSHRSGQDLSLVTVDIDFFKRVNDTGGHPVGDLVLKTVAGILKSHIRMTDTLGRIGGEEFAILLPNTSLEGAGYVAESLRRLIESKHFAPWPGHDGHITASFGCASLAADDTEAALIARSDMALYEAKTTGRNRVVTVVVRALPDAAVKAASST